MKKTRIMLLVFAFAFCVSALSAQADEKKPTEGHIMVMPSDLVWRDVPSLPPGAQIAVIEGNLMEAEPYTFRLRLPAGYKVPVHTHPVVERVTVISGTFSLGIGDKFDPEKTMELTPGSVAIMEKGVPMFAFTKGGTVIQIHGTGPWGLNYVYPEDAPKGK